MQIISQIITNVLTALYQPFWFAVILSVLFKGGNGSAYREKSVNT